VNIQSIDLFYFALPHIRDQADGSQDTFIARVRSDTGLEGFGESDSSPLLAFASFCMPMSHSNLVNLSASLVGRRIDSPDDVRRVYQHAKRRALDLAQFPHAYAAADIALWDLLGKHLKSPVYKLLGHQRALPKRAYSSQLFQDTPEATAALARTARQRGFTAAKFGWGPMGMHGEAFDIDLVRHAREGLGADVALMVDAGVVWKDDYRTVLKRAEAFATFDVTWLEEPLSSEAVSAYGQLAGKSPIPIAAGEGCNTVRAAEDLLENGKLSFLQIDPGRIGGITPAFETYHLARKHGATFVNHTYKSQISLAAAMAVFAGDADMPWLEFCESGSPLVRQMIANPLNIDERGEVLLLELPGLGLDVRLDQMRDFAREIVITIDKQVVGVSQTG